MLCCEPSDSFSRFLFRMLYDIVKIKGKVKILLFYFSRRIKSLELHFDSQINE